MQCLFLRLGLRGPSYLHVKIGQQENIVLTFTFHPPLEHGTSDFCSLLPFRSSVQEPGWDTVLAELTDRCALFLSLHRIPLFAPGFRIGDHRLRKEGHERPGHCDKGPWPGRVNNTRTLEGQSMNVEAFRARLSNCREKHRDRVGEGAHDEDGSCAPAQTASGLSCKRPRARGGSAQEQQVGTTELMRAGLPPHCLLHSDMHSCLVAEGECRT